MEAWCLVDDGGRCFPLRFDCERCVMEILGPAGGADE